MGKNARDSFAKRKRNRSIRSNNKIVGRRESRRERAAPWPERGESERKYGVKIVSFTLNEGGFQEGQAERAILGEEEKSMSY